MKGKVGLFVILILVLLIPINVKAISFNAQISGDNQVEVLKTIKLKMEYITSNDLWTDDDGTSVGEISRDDITENSVWSSSNTEIATVDKGVVTGKKAGKVTITAVGKRSEDSSAFERSASYEIEVIEPVSEVTPSVADDPIVNQPSVNPSTSVSVPSTKAAIPLYIAVIGSLFIILAFLVYIFICKRKEE